ncbi:MAG: WecB/TagA/CpsF family glycosyltransferase [Romboutsia sp.]|nr:WecB/TagA/CpsF family glycosyltransferase [Romboutsia sp.]
MGQFLDSKNIIIPDGISVSIPLKRKYKENIKRITGIDLMKEILKEFEKEGKTVYFLGSKEDVLKDMILNISNAYPKLVIKGSHHGYIDTNKCEQLIYELKNVSPDVLFVAMGTPIQEDFIFKYIDVLPCKVYMGVGGSFDVISGNVKRCPKWISTLGIEWLYRMLKDPKKIKRIWNNIFFTLKGLVKG